MANEIGKYVFPPDIGKMTLQQLANLEGVEATISGGRVSVRSRTANKVVTIQMQEDLSSGYKSKKFTEINKPIKKKELEETMKKLKKEGIKQKEIAYELGVSEAYVSKLLRNKDG